MSAEEFGLHHAIELEEPLPAVQMLLHGSTLAAVANGALKEPEPGRLWAASDFVRMPWRKPEAPAQPTDAAPQTVEEIMRSFHAAGGR